MGLSSAGTTEPLPNMPRILRDLIFNRLASSILLPTRWRWRVLRALGLDIQPSLISSGCFIGTKRLRIGRDTQIAYQCFFDTSDWIDIGEAVAIGPRCTLITGSHRIGGPEQRIGGLIAAPISVGRGAWLGAGVLVYPGVQIGEGAVVNAGSVVTKDVPPHTLSCGNPAAVVRSLRPRLDVAKAAGGAALPPRRIRITTSTPT